jgi:mutator protein MutT
VDGSVVPAGAGKYDGALVIHVVAGAVIDATGRVLIAQRPPGKHLAGGWEFPGGKLEPGEARTAGLARELGEELGIAIRTPRPLIRVRHTYPYGEVLIDMWVVKNYSGEPRGLDGQALRWLTQDELERAELLPADGPIVRALRLPDRLSDASTSFYEVREACRQGEDAGGKLHGVYCSTVEAALVAARAGADFIVMRPLLQMQAASILCRTVSVPVYLKGTSRKSAFALGATGINAIAL